MTTTALAGIVMIALIFITLAVGFPKGTVAVNKDELGNSLV